MIGASPRRCCNTGYTNTPKTAPACKEGCAGMLAHPSAALYHTFPAAAERPWNVPRICKRIVGQWQLDKG